MSKKVKCLECSLLKCNNSVYYCEYDQEEPENIENPEELHDGQCSYLPKILICPICGEKKAHYMDENYSRSQYGTEPQECFVQFGSKSAKANEENSADLKLYVCESCCNEFYKTFR